MGEVEHTSVDLVQSFSMVAAAEKHHIRAWSFSNEGNLCDTRQNRSIGRAKDPQTNLLSMVAHTRLDSLSYA